MHRAEIALKIEGDKGLGKIYGPHRYRHRLERNPSSFCQKNIAKVNTASGEFYRFTGVTSTSKFAVTQPETYRDGVIVGLTRKTVQARWVNEKIWNAQSEQFYPYFDIIYAEADQLDHFSKI